MNKRIFYIIILIFSQIFTLSSQDLYFSQFFLNSIDLNPAMAGASIQPRMFLHYRNQWPDFGSTFVTYQVSYDQYISKMKGGFGLNLMRDNIANGIITNTEFDLMYAYRFKASRKLTVQLGTAASFHFFNIDKSIITSNSTTPVSTSAAVGSQQPDLGIGFLGITRYSLYGISVKHLNPGFIRFNYNFVSSPYKFNFYYSRNFTISNLKTIQPTVYMLTPAILVQKQSGSTYINYGASLRQGNIMVGLWGRTNLPMQFTTAIFSCGYTFGNWEFGYSYDYNLLSTQNLMPVTGAHEISIIAVFPVDPKRKRYGPISCPKFIEE